MATSFLVIAPNVIVFERLKTDFGDGATFRRDPLVPPEWADDFDLTVLLQDDPAPVTTRGVLYLTNVQRLYEPPTRGKQQGRAEPRRGDARSARQPRRRRRARPRSCSTGSPTAGGCMVVNDEAHHVWDEKLKWNQTIERLHAELRERTPDDPAPASSRSSTSRRRRRIRRAASSATSSSTTRSRRPSPTGSSRRRSSARSRARRSSSATRPSSATASGSTSPSAAGASSTRRSRPSGKRPGAVRHVREHAGGRRGRRLPAPAPGLRRRPAARHPHEPLRRDHQGRPRHRPHGRRARSTGPTAAIRCIVSVLMLREGWDVRNVCVIVTLRSLTARRRSCPSRRSAAGCGG